MSLISRAALTVMTSEVIRILNGVMSSWVTFVKNCNLTRFSSSICCCSKCESRISCFIRIR